MEDALNAIATAITGLQSNPIKDYIFPAISAFSTAALGAWAAFYAVSTQESNRIHIENVDAINEALLSACEARLNLLAIKENYVSKLTSDPFQRLLSIPPIVLNSEAITYKVVRLAFLAPSEDREDLSRWQNIQYIDTLFQNYNSVLSIWKKRNDVMQQIMPHVIDHHGTKVSYDDLVPVIGHGNIAVISDLTEQALLLTDDLIVELSCFVLGFSEVSKKLIPSKIKKKYRKVLSMTLPETDAAKELLSPSPELDLSSASQIHKTTIEHLQQRYRRIYNK